MAASTASASPHAGMTARSCAGGADKSRYHPSSGGPGLCQGETRHSKAAGFAVGSGEASITPFSAYGTPLDAANLAAYRSIVEKGSAPVIAPSPKRFVPDDMARLAATGITGALIGVVVTGQTPESLYAAVAPITRAASRLG